VSVCGRASESGDATSAACDRTACHSLGSHTHAVAMTLSTLGHQHYHLNMQLKLAAAAGGAVGNDGQSAWLADSSTPSHSAASQ